MALFAAAKNKRKNVSGKNFIELVCFMTVMTALQASG
jgi:hypothetical protein